MIPSGIGIGDQVHIGGTLTRGEVVEIDDHPFEYGMLLIRFKSGAGEVEVWESSRLAAKIKPGVPVEPPLTAADLRHIGRH